MALLPFDNRDGSIWLDGTLVPWRDVRLHVLSHGLHYASTVFEGERAYGGTIFRLRDHTNRLLHSGRVLGFEIPWTADQIDAACAAVVAANGLTDAYVRPIAWRGSEVMGVTPTGTSVHLARSFKLGAIRLTERFVTADPLAGKDERRLEAHITREVRRHIAQITTAGFDRVIGTSGTILSLGALAGAAGARRGRTSDLRHLRVGAKPLHRLRRQLVGMRLEERLAMPGMDPRRADLIVAGSVLLDTLLQMLGASELTLCDLALREGMILDYIHTHRQHIAHIDQIPDVRRRSTLELAERCNYLEPHARQVVRLSLALFDQSRSVHGLSEREREWLEHAALMHDIGVHISYPRHHRHSQYLIENGDLRGFEPDEITVMGLVARYHRRGTPKNSNPEFAGLPGPLRRTVRVLAAMLRLAENLDRSHSQVISGLELTDAGEQYHLRVQTTTDAELELWAAHRYSGPLEKVLGKPIRLEATSTGEPVIVNTEFTRRK